MQDFIKINDNDNVVVALKTIPAGEKLYIPTGKKDRASESGCEARGIPAQEIPAKGVPAKGIPAKGIPAQEIPAQEIPAEENISGKNEEKENQVPKAALEEDGSPQHRGMQEVAVLEEIPAGHKMAIRDIPEGGEVIKYGYCIGNAKEFVRAGAWVHTHNLKTALGDLLEYAYEPVFPAYERREIRNFGSGNHAFEAEEKAVGGAGRAQGAEEKATGSADRAQGAEGKATGSVGRAQGAEEKQLGSVDSVSAAEEKTAASESGACGAEKASGQGVNGATFMGFRRPDGQVGVRNEIWVIPTVGCVNNVAAAIADKANRMLASMPAPERGSVDEVIAFPHPYGCSQMGEDQEHTRQILADLVKHPNAGGVLVLGLGCENSNIEVLKPYIGEYDENRVKFLVSQECADEVKDALEIIDGIIGYASVFKREPVGVDRLVIGMKCGGSDGLSGITANPLVGRFSDRLIGEGGTTILTEVPEMFGAETILMNRCANEALFRQTVALINDFKNYYKSHNQTIYENPSPGNKMGGISTLEDKSLGCTQKSGSAPVMGVLQYGERIRVRGLNLLSAPGNDLVAATALAAAGAHIVLFTTGRGTPFASPVPTVKISTNSALAGKKANWIDYNAGVLVEGQGMEEETERLFGYVVEVASGRKVCSEEAGYHDMAIFKQGVTL